MHEGEHRILAALSVMADEAGSDAERSKQQRGGTRLVADDDERSGGKFEDAGRPGDESGGWKTERGKVAGRASHVA